MTDGKGVFLHPNKGENTYYILYLPIERGRHHSFFPPVQNIAMGFSRPRLVFGPEIRSARAITVCKCAPLGDLFLFLLSLSLYRRRERERFQNLFWDCLSALHQKKHPFRPSPSDTLLCLRLLLGAAQIQSNNQTAL